MPSDVYLGLPTSLLPQLPPSAVSTLWGVMSMALVASDFFGTPLGGVAKTMECNLTWLGVAHQIGPMFACWTAHLQPPEDFTGEAPGHLIIGLRARQFRCGPRRQNSVIDGPHQALQCFAIGFIPGNLFQLISGAWGSVACC